MLSGIGPAAHLRAHGIAVRVDLPGVGRNLQDRYEVAVTHRMRAAVGSAGGRALRARRSAVAALERERAPGMYASNGAALGVVQPLERREAAEPDIFCMALLARFEGYFRGLLRAGSATHHDHLTWAVLKAHTQNRAGTVRLRSADPRDTPLVNFHYFEEGSDAAGEDLQAVVEAIRFVRRLTAPLIASGVDRRGTRARARRRTSDEALADYVRDTAWGHHASCSCPIGAAERGRRARQRVRGARHAAAARRRCVGVPAHPGLLRRERGLHDRREGGRCDPADAAPHAPFGKLTAPVDWLTLREQRAYRRGEDAWPTTLQQLLAMSQQQLDDLFRASPAGDIPNGEAEGTAIIAPGTKYSAADRARSSITSAGRARCSTPRRALLKNKHPGVRRRGHRRQGLQGRRAGSTARSASCSTTPRPRSWRTAIRDEIRLIGAELLSRQGVLGQGPADRLLPAVLMR